MNIHLARAYVNDQQAQGSKFIPMGKQWKNYWGNFENSQLSSVSTCPKKSNKMMGGGVVVVGRVGGERLKSGFRIL